MSNLLIWVIVSILIIVGLYLISKKDNKGIPLDTKRRPFSFDEKVHVIEKNVQHYGFARCTRCGAGKNFSIDHIIPLDKRGGHNGLDNLQLLCKRCNSKKGNK